jgi:tetratricopeptide (TPR) repeat protein/predicted Ser/Thr protein kinase
MMGVGVDSSVEEHAEPDTKPLPEASEGERLSQTPANTAARPGLVGRYRILRLVGEGGMGVVYEAEQDQPRRRVALKVIKPGLARPELLRRFEQESQALGRLQHPGIAQIYEAGTADTGFGPQPYFAMEFIHGKSVKDYAEERQLNTRQRLEMVAKIADAVQHAHQRGLIHRDLKPANILVDETGQPKILDFGVARATDSDTHATGQTNMGQLVGTLAYMSPEQVLADPLGLDTRSDVYALGVILYELLAGRMPYTISKQLHETIQAIREEDPTKLGQISRSYRGDIETIVAKALEKDKARRYGSAAELAADITRHLKDEPIVARPPSASYQLRKFARRHKALVTGVAAVFVVLLAGIATSTRLAVRAKSAEAAAVEARDRAVQAEAKTAVERDSARDARNEAEAARNEAEAATSQTQRERDNAVIEKQRADSEAAIAQALNEFLGKDLLGMANPLAQAESSLAGQPAITPNPNLTVREALDRTAGLITTKFEKQPPVEAALHETVGGIYLGLGRLEEAQAQLERAVAIRRSERGEEHRDTLKTKSDLASLYLIRNNLQAARDLWEHVLRHARRTLGDDDPLTRRSLVQLVETYKRSFRMPVAETLLANLVEDQRSRLGEDNPTTLETIRLLVALFETFRPGDSAHVNHVAAEAFLRRLLAHQRRSLGEANNATVNSVNLLSRVYTAQQKYSEAEVFLNEILESQRRTLSSDNPATRATANLLAAVFLSQNKFKAAEDLLIPLVPDATMPKFVKAGRRNSEELSTTLESMRLLAEVYSKSGKSAQVHALQENIAKLKQVAYGPGLPEMVKDEDVVARVLNIARGAAEYATLGLESEAQAFAIEAVEGYGRVAGAKDPRTILIGNTLVGIAREFGSKGRYDHADTLLMKVLGINKAVYGSDDEKTMSVMADVGGAYQSFGQYERAANVLTDLWNIQVRLFGERHPNSLRTMGQLESAYWHDARSEQAKGACTQAKAQYAHAAELMTRHLKISLSVSHAEEQPDSLAIRLQLGQVYGAQGEYKKAEEVFLELRSAPLPPGVFSDSRNPQVRGIVTHLGWARLHQGKYVEAEAVLREAIPFFDQSDGPGLTIKVNWSGILGASLVAQKRYAEAEPRLLSSYEGRALGIIGPWSPGTRGQAPILFTAEEAGNWILRLYKEWGKPDKVIEWQRMLQADKAALRTPIASVLASVCENPLVVSENTRKEE